mgnify:CR=1 FL=1
MLKQLRVELSPNVILGDVGQFKDITHLMLKFYEYVGIGKAEHKLWQSLVWKSAQVFGFIHFGTQLKVNGSPYKSRPPLPE